MLSFLLIGVVSSERTFFNKFRNFMLTQEEKLDFESIAEETSTQYSVVEVEIEVDEEEQNDAKVDPVKISRQMNRCRVTVLTALIIIITILGIVFAAFYLYTHILLEAEVAKDVATIYSISNIMNDSFSLNMSRKNDYAKGMPAFRFDAWSLDFGSKEQTFGYIECPEFRVDNPAATPYSNYNCTAYIEDSNGLADFAHQILSSFGVGGVPGLFSVFLRGNMFVHSMLLTWCVKYRQTYTFTTGSSETDSTTQTKPSMKLLRWRPKSNGISITTVFNNTSLIIANVGDVGASVQMGPDIVSDVFINDFDLNLGNNEITFDLRIYRLFKLLKFTMGGSENVIIRDISIKTADGLSISWIDRLFSGIQFELK